MSLVIGFGSSSRPRPVMAQPWTARATFVIFWVSALAACWATWALALALIL